MFIVVCFCFCFRDWFYEWSLPVLSRTARSCHCGRAVKLVELGSDAIKRRSRLVCRMLAFEHRLALSKKRTVCLNARALFLDGFGFAFESWVISWISNRSSACCASVISRLRGLMHLPSESVQWCLLWWLLTPLCWKWNVHWNYSDAQGVGWLSSINLLVVLWCCQQYGVWNCSRYEKNIRIGDLYS